MRTRLRWVAVLLGLTGCASASPWGDPGDTSEPADPLAPGGYHLLETIVTTSPHPTPFRIEVFLPDGPVEGGRVFMRPEANRRYVQTFSGTLHEGTVSLPAYRQGTVRLDVSDACLTATFEDGAFLFDVRQGDVTVTPAPTQRFCPIAGSEATTVVVRSPVDTAPGPLTSLEVLGALVEPDSLAGAVVRTEGRTLPLTYAGDETGGLLVLPEVVPLGQSFTIEIPDLRTVLGTPASASTWALGTHDVVTDLSFDSAPPEGAISTVGYPLVHEGGALVLNDEGGGIRWSPFSGLIALGEVGAATTIHISGAAATRFGGATMMSLYREGSAPSASTVFTGDLSLPIPAGTGPVWLAIENEEVITIPLDRTGPFVFSIDAIALE